MTVSKAADHVHNTWEIQHSSRKARADEPNVVHSVVGHALILAAAHLLLCAAGLVLAQIPEPNCNSNTYEGNEVWSAVPNFIGAGTGGFW